MTALKTVSARIRGSKSDLEELGEGVDELAQGFSKYAKEIQALTGFNIMVEGTTDQFKDLYDIFEGVAAVWDKLSDTQQARVAEILGGTRQLQVIASIIGNWGDAANAYSTAMNSAGAATKANDIYMETAAAHIAQLKATFQELAMNLVSSGLIKFFVDIANALLNFINTLTRLHLLLPAIVAAIVTIKGFRIAKSVKSIASTLMAQKVVTDNLKTSIATLTEAQKRALRIQIEQAAVEHKISDDRAKEIIATYGLAGAEGTLTAANTTLATSFKALWASIPVWGQIAIAVTAVVSVVGALVSLFGGSSKSIQELDSELDELISDAKNAASEFSSLKASVDDVLPRFAELAKGVDSFGKNVSLTDEEYAEFWELNNKLAEMFPELDMGLDSNGNHILALSYSVDTLTESIKALIEAERQAANESIADKMEDTLDNMDDANDAYDKQIDKLVRQRETLEAAYQKVKGMSPGDSTSIPAMPAFRDAVKGLGVDVSSGGYQTHIYNFDPDEVARNYENQLASLERQIDSINSRRAARWAKLNPIVGAWLQTEDSYSAAEDNVRELLTKIIGNIDYSNLDITDDDDLKEFIKTNYIDPITTATPEVQDAIASMFDAKTAFDSGKLSVENYRKLIYQITGELRAAGIGQNVIEALLGSLDTTAFWDEIKFVKENIKGEVDDIQEYVNGLSGYELKFAYKILADDGSMTIEELQEKVVQAVADANQSIDSLGAAYSAALSNFSGVADAINNVSDSLKTVADLQETVANGFTISLDKALEFASVYPEILNGATVAADGQIALNEDVVNAFIEGKEAEFKAQIDAKIVELEAEKNVLTAKKDFAQAELDLAKSVGEGEGKITQDLAEYRVNAGNAAVKALIEAGIDEATAYQLAMAAMSQNSEEFNRIAAQVCTDVNGNFNQTAYDAAQTMYHNMRNAASSVDGVTSAAHEMGKAIKAAASGEQAGRTGTFSGGGGFLGKGAKITLSNGTFNGHDYSYDPKTITLDKFISDLELDISSYTNAIAQIDGQIAALTALRNTNLSKFSSSNRNGGSGGSGGGGGSGSGSPSSAKEESVFKTLYDYHKHLIEMEKETTGEFLKWLDDAYKDAYVQGEITLDEYYKYEEEVFKGLRTLEKNAKSAIDSLVDYRIKMLKQDLSDEKDNLKKRLDALKDFYDKQKQLLQDAADEEKYLDDQAEKRKSVTEIQAELAQLERDNSAWAQKRKLQLQQDLAEAQKELDEFERDHALELALDALDNAYDEQQARIQAEMDALEEKLNDPQALFNQALEDIKNNTLNTYNEMIKFNRANGDGKDETIEEMWEEAFKANEEYKAANGSGYNGINIGNYTGYTTPTASTSGGSSGSSGSGNSGSTTSSSSSSSSSKPKLDDDTKRKVAAAIWNGGYGWGHNPERAARLTEVFGADNGIQALVNKNVGKNDRAPGSEYTYLNMRKKFKGYALGTRSAAPGLHAIDELGTETIFQSANGTRYKMFTGGEKVLNAKASNFLYDFANQGRDILDKLVRSVFGGTFGGVTPPVTHNEITMGNIVIQGNADNRTVSEIRRAQRDSVEDMLKAFNRLNK